MNVSNNSNIDHNDLAKRGESLIRKSTNRYLTTVRIAFRAKQRRFDDFDGLLDESTIKPVQRSIIELSDEQDQPEMVFEISFEKIQFSKRHKSGIAVRFPRITKWRKDKKINDADSLENAFELMRKKS